MFYSNMLNSSLITINTNEAIKILKIYHAKFKMNNRVSLQKPFLRFNNYQELIRFVKNMISNVVTGKEDWTLGTVFLPNQKIFDLKRLDNQIVFKTKIGSKITI